VILIAEGGAAPAEIVRPIAAALLAGDVAVHRVDVGRGVVGVKAVDRLVQAVLGDAERRRLEKELETITPEVAVAFDPASAAALVALRDARRSTAPVVAVVPDLAPKKAWACDADRFVVVDDEAAVALSELGVDGARVIVVGPIVALQRAEAARESKAAVREKFKLPADATVLVVEARGVDVEVLSQLVLQLALLEKKVFTLFDAGDDAAAAAHLRRQVPGLGLKGKLFGAIADAPLLWRAADVVLARPRTATIHATLAAGCGFAALAPQGPHEQAEANALRERGLGAAVPSGLVLAATLDPLLTALAGGKTDRGAPDGAAAVASLVRDVAADREAVLEETFAAARERKAASHAEETRAAEAHARGQAPAGDLEDLGGGEDEDLPPPSRGPDRATMDRLRSEVMAAQARARKELEDARADADRWDQRRVLAERKGDAALAADAAREADRKRARMHTALEELSRLDAEAKRLAGLSASSAPGPSVDDVLGAMKQEASRKGNTIEDELAALKKKMSTEKPKR
jgi:UDP-N-acetylglucosamine:LPS N-acetylglucosamine transferase